MNNKLFYKKNKSIMKTSKLIPMVQFILDIDWMTTIEFCNTYEVPHPQWTGDVRTSADKFLQVDAIKHKMFTEYAKFLSKKLTVKMFTGTNPKIIGFESVDVRGGNPKFKNGKYEITNDEFGFFLEPYDSVDGCRISRVEDLVNYGFSYNTY